MKPSLVKWKVKHSKEIEWCTQLSHSCQQCRQEREASAAGKDLPGRSRAAIVWKAADTNRNLTSHFDAELGNFENKPTVQKGQTIHINAEKRAKGMSENKLSRNDCPPPDHNLDLSQYTCLVLTG